MSVHQLVASLKRHLTPSQGRALDGVADAIAPLLEEQEAKIYAERLQLVAKLETVGERHRPGVEKTAAAYAAALTATAKAKEALQHAREREQAAISASYSASYMADREDRELREELVKTAPAIVIRACEAFYNFNLSELQPIVDWSPDPLLNKWDREFLEANGGVPLEFRPVPYLAEYRHAIDVMREVRNEAEALLYRAQTEAEAFEAVETLFRRANAVIVPLKGRTLSIGENGQIKLGPGQRGVNLAPTPEEPTK